MAMLAEFPATGNVERQSGNLSAELLGDLIARLYEYRGYQFIDGKLM